MVRSVIGVVLLAGCGGRGVSEVAFVPGNIPGTGQVTFTSDAEGEARVEMTVAGADVVSPAVPAAGGAVPLLGLQTGKVYEMRVVVDDGGKETESDPIEVTIPPPSRGLPPVSVAVSEPDQMCDPGGYILFSYLGDDKSGVGIIDREGNYVWTVSQDDATLQVGRARPGRDGHSILWNEADEAKCSDVATITRQPMDGSDRTVTRTNQGHHDFVELPNGRVAWLGYRMEPAPEELGFERDVLVAADTIYEADEGNSDAAVYDVVFDTWEHYPPGVHSIPPDAIQADGSPSFLCTGEGDEPEWGAPAFEFGHGNSLAYVESQDAFYMMWRWLDNLIKVDRSNPADPYVWEMGGEFSTLPLTGGEPFYHAHMSDIIDGTMLVFDNRTREVNSRLVQYDFDDDGAEQVWEYESDAYENLLGDVRRIPVDGCDNLLVSWSNQGRISEITRDGTVVWDVTSAIGNVMSRVYYLPDLYDFSGVAYPP